MYHTIIEWLEAHLLSCPIKQHTGLACPGCGMQRAFVELLKGNVIDSIRFFPALLPMIGLILFVLAHLKFDFQYGARIVIIWFCFNFGVVLCNYAHYLWLL